MSDDQDILIDEDGTVRFVYTDLLDQVFAGERRETTRASHVEPYDGGWAADMRPSNGGILGANGEAHVYGSESRRWWLGENNLTPLRPFATRQAALDAERAWLREHRGL